MAGGATGIRPLHEVPAVTQANQIRSAGPRKRSGACYCKEKKILKNKLFKRAAALLLALVCAVGVLPLSAFATGGPSGAPASITQKSCDYVKVNGRFVSYETASSVINSEGLPYVFDEQMEVPGYGVTRALCAYHKGGLTPDANGQKWDFKEGVNSTSLKAIITYVYSHAYRNFTGAGSAVGLET